MSDSPDRLSLLRGRYQEQIRTKRAELEALQQKVALIDELEAESATLKNHPIAATAGRYSEMRLIDAVLDAMNESNGDRVSIAQVKKHLLDNGFSPKGKNFAISVSTTLRRLTEQGKLNSDLKDGKRSFWKKAAEYRVVMA